MQTVRVGIIGPGRILREKQVPRLKQVPGVELRLVWARDPSRARAVADEFGIKDVADEWREVAESPDVDAVLISTPPVLHRDATIAALDAGKHVLCQARMARNLKEAQEMHRAAQATDLVTALYPPRPGLRGDRVVRRMLNRGDLGDIREVRVMGMLPAGGKTYHWRHDPEVTGINAFTLGMWAEVLNRWVGPATSVVAKGKTHEARRETTDGGSRKTPVPDSLAIAADLDCGAIASYHFSSTTGYTPHQAIEIYGTKSAIVYDLTNEQLWGARAGDNELHVIEVPPDEVREQTTDAEFIDAIRNGTPVSPDFTEGLRYMEFTEAVAQSLMTGQLVALPPEPKLHAWGKYL